MYGFEAISIHNGWAMAFAGVVIVFAGLVVLSATIAQLHKFLTFLDNRLFHSQRGKKDADAVDPIVAQSLGELARQFKLISDRIGEPFALPMLLELADLSGLPRSHSTVNDLLKAGFIVPDGKGYFLWKL